MAGKGKKIVGGILSLLLLLIVLALCVFIFWLGPTVKMVAEHIGSKALGTPLTIKELKINPRDGTFHLSGFALANPNTFGRTNAVSLAGLDIGVDIGSIFTQTVVVHRVQINSPHLVYEQGVATDNVSEFIKNIETYMGPGEPEQENENPEEAVSGESKVVVVEQLEVNDVQLHLANTTDPMLDIEARIDQLAVSMTNGVMEMKGFRITNPGRLEAPDLFTLDDVTVRIDPSTIYASPLSILDVQMVRPYAFLEHNPQTDTVKEFMKIADRLAKAEAEDLEKVETMEEMNPVEEVPATESESPTGPPPIELHNLLVDDIQLKLIDTAATNAPAGPRMLAGIGSISAKLVDGRIQIKGISVPNPAGYQSTNLFHLADIDISLDPDSLFSGQVDVKQILVNTPKINLEQTETSGNVADLQTQLTAFVPQTAPTSGETTPMSETVASTETKPEPVPFDEQPVVLHSLIVTNFAIHLSMPISTNKPPVWAVGLSDMEKLNPLEKLSLGKLNPLAKKEDATEKAPENGPLKLVYFDHLKLRPLDGTLQVDGLGVANPPGFSNPNLVQLNQFRIDVDPTTLQDNILVIRDILIDKPRIAYERRVTTDNLKAMQKEIEKSVGDKNESSDQLEAEQEMKETDADGQKVIIGHFLVKDGLVKAKLSVAPSLPIPLPDIEMTDIGKDKGGTTFLGAVTEIGTTIYASIIGVVSGATGFAGDALKGVGTLTLGALGAETPEESAKPETDTQPSTATVEPAPPTVQREVEERKPRNNHRLPGRRF